MNGSGVQARGGCRSGLGWVAARGVLLAIWASASAVGNPVLDWSALMMSAIRSDNTGPTLSTRNLAILNIATYEAVNAIHRTHQPYRFAFEVAAGASPEAAVISAGREVMLALYPSLAGRTEELYQAGLVELPATEGVTRGLALGRESARSVLDLRTGDGASTDVPYIPSSAPGQWQRTPPFFRPPLTPQWRYVDPFCLPSVEAFLPPPPPALDSPEYAAAFAQVKALGGKTSAVRTAEQGQIAVFWSDFSYTAMPPGHWHEITASICRNEGTSLEETARLFALLGMAQADAAIVCWEAKYRWNLWRPVTAIRRAGEDGSPATEPDPTWDHLLGSPPFPAYTSGHSTFSKASAQVLTRFFGRDDLTFTAQSDSLPGVFRTFSSLAACADEIGMSRIYGGIHYPFDNVEGKRTGGRVGDFVSRNFLLPNAALPAVWVESFVSGVPVLRVHGHAGTTCVVEGSSDLRQWSSVSTNVAAPGGVVVFDARGGSGRAGFYRVREF